jgi:radical SAM protein with 4Fe4S-binding SPASM domain
VVRQRRARERRETGYGARRAAAVASGNDEIGPAEMLMPAAAGVLIQKSAKPGGHPEGLNAMTKGCLAGTGVCFISFAGSVYPCGYLPVEAGNLQTQTFREVWEQSAVFAALRDAANLKGKCGACEFRNVCMGCRARAYAATGDMLDEEPFCIYQPKSHSAIGPV